MEYIRFIFIIQIAAVLVSCSSSPPIVETYTLFPAATEHDISQSLDMPIIAIEQPKTIGIFNSHFLIERKENQLLQDKYRCWSPPPADMLALSLRNAFDKHTTVSVHPTSRYLTPFTFKTLIKEWTYEIDESGCNVVIAVETYLENNEDHQPVFRKMLCVRNAAKEQTFPAIVDAFSGALESLSSNCAINIAEIVDTSSSKTQSKEIK